MIKKLIILTFLALGFSLFAKKTPNVILCMCDDMGWGDTHYNGHPKMVTPALDDMVASGLRMNRFYAASAVCSPTRGSCLTGRNPMRYGISTANKGHLKSEEVNLAEVFKAKGYSTGHFGKWHLGTLSPDFSGKGEKRKPEENYMTPGMAGFDEWFSTEFAVATYDPYNPKYSHTKAWNKDEKDFRAMYWHNGQPLEQELEGCDSKIIMDRAIPFVKENAEEEQPFFMVIWFHTPHAPVVAHPKYAAEYYADCDENQQAFYSSITAMDVQMGRLRQALKDNGVADNTLLFFTSDNGPEGSGGKRKKYQGETGGLKGRKRSLYEGGIRVPGIVEWPAVIKAGSVTEMPVVTSDYFTTCCELLGFNMPDERPMDGINIMPLLEGKMDQRDKNIGFIFGKQRALTGNRYKLVYNQSVDKIPENDRRDFENTEYELYDIIEDAGENNNIAADHPEVVAEMKKELHAFIKSCDESSEGLDYE